jgi:hypothetical protein
MELLSEDDLNLQEMTPEELDLAWDLWFDLAQATNDFDPPYTHGVFVLCQAPPPAEHSEPVKESPSGPASRFHPSGSGPRPDGT